MAGWAVSEPVSPAPLRTSHAQVSAVKSSNPTHATVALPITSISPLCDVSGCSARIIARTSSWIGSPSAIGPCVRWLH